jgi:hypothetical protein
MERIVYRHVYNHLVNNNLIYKYQSGFLPKHSTVHQLLELYNSILNSLEKKEFSCFVFCDFSKAFDKVWHTGLIHKMNSYGIVLIVDGQWNVLAKTQIGIYIWDCY